MKKLPYIIAAVFIGLLLFQQCRIRSLKSESQLKSVEISTLKDSVDQYINEKGELTYKLQSIELQHSDAKEALEKAGFEIKDLKDRDIKWRNAVFALQSQLSATGTGKTIIKDTLMVYKTDTVKRATFDWNNKYLFLSGTIFENQMDFSYNYRTKIKLVQEKTKGKYIVSVYLDDPKASITSANSITIIKNKRWWDRWWIYAGAGFAGGFFLAK